MNVGLLKYANILYNGGRNERVIMIKPGKTTILAACLVFVAAFIVSPSAADDEQAVKRSLVIAATNAEFQAIARNAGWLSGHVANNDTSVSAVNYYKDAAVYSSDGVLLFYVYQEAATRSIIAGYIQLANYDRTSKKSSMLVSLPLSDAIRLEPVHPVVRLGLSRKEFSTETARLGWTDYLIPINDKQVRPVNLSKVAPVYTKDGFLLFWVGRDEADYMLASGYMSLASIDRKSPRLNSSPRIRSRMPSSA